MSMKLTSLAKLLMTVSFMLLAINALLIETAFLDGTIEKNLLRVVALMLSVLAAIMVIKKPQDDIFILFMILIGTAVITFNPDQLTLIYLVVLLHASLVFEGRELVRRLFLANAFVFALIFVFLLLDVTHNEIREFRNRATFGLNGIGGPTLFFNILYGFLILGSLSVQQRLRNLFSIATIFICLYFYIQTDVRGGAAAYLIFVLLLYALPTILNIRFTHLFIKLIPVVLTTFAILTGFLLNSEVYNEMLSNRPSLYSSFLTQIDFVDLIFGTSVKAFDLSSIVDNSYIHLLIGGGLPFFGYFMFRFWRSMGYLISTRKYGEISFLIATSLYFSVESLAVRIENMFVIYFWAIVFLNPKCFTESKNYYWVRFSPQNSTSALKI